MTKLSGLRIVSFFSMALLALVWLLPSWGGTAVGQPAENFTLSPPEGGKAVSLAQFKGKPTMVVFWATWCGPCRREVPLLKNIHREYSSKGLQMLAVAIDYRETREDVLKFKQTNELPYTILWDDDNRISQQYEVEGVPTVLLVDSKGVIRYRGFHVSAEFMTVLDSLVKK